MANFSWYIINEKYYKVCSFRIHKHSYRIVVKKIKKKWQVEFGHLKLEYLDIVPLYYEVGLLKYQDSLEKEKQC